MIKKLLCTLLVAIVSMSMVSYAFASDDNIGFAATSNGTLVFDPDNPVLWKIYEKDTQKQVVVKESHQFSMHIPPGLYSATVTYKGIKRTRTFSTGSAWHSITVNF